MAVGSWYCVFGGKQQRRLLILFLLLAIACAGCWDRREPELLAFVLAVGFDKDRDSGDYKIVAQIFNPLAMSQQSGGEGAGGQDKRPSWVVEATGRTPFEARKNLAPMVSRELFWSYARVVLISEQLAREGIRPVMDLLERERQFRLIARPLIVEGDISKALVSEYPLEGCSGQALLRQLETGDKMRSIAPVIETRELINILSQPGRDLLIARLGVRNPKKGVLGERKLDEDEKIVATPPPIYLGGGAAFRSDKMVGWIGNREARAHHWVLGKVRRETLVVESPLDGLPVSIEVFRAQSNMKPKINGDRVTMQIKLQVKGRIQDQVTASDLVSNREALSRLELRFATLIANDIKAAVKQAQELNSDFLGFGNVIYRLQPREWEQLKSDWPQLLSQMKLDLNVEAKVTVAGLIKEPVRIK
jgi:spore germination protein KC